MSEFVAARRWEVALGSGIVARSTGWRLIESAFVDGVVADANSHRRAQDSLYG